jgi:HK97 family phage major capsid protein
MAPPRVPHNPMWIELLSPVGDLKPGFHDVADEAVARAYIAANLARDAGDGPDKIILQRSMEHLRTEMSNFTRGIATELRESATAFKGGVHASVIEPGQAEADKTKGPGDFLRQVYYVDGCRDRELASSAMERLEKVYGAKRGMTEGTGSSGGYSVPVTYEAMIQMVEAEDAVIYPYAQEVPLGGGGSEWPCLDQFQVPTPGQSASFGGVKVYRKGENVQRTASQAALKKINLKPYDLTAYTEVSRDLLADASIPIDGLVTRLIGEAMGWREDWECLNGSGVGQFLGIYNAPCTIQVTRNTGGAIKYVDITGMYKRMMAAGMKTACWIIHNYTIDALLQIQDGTGRYIFQPYAAPSSSVLGAAPTFMMLGLPVYVTEKAPILGSTGDLGLFDRKRYLKGVRSGLEIGLSEHFKFDTDQVAIRAKKRGDGQPQLLKAMTLADGSSTVSSFIVLN